MVTHSRLRGMRGVRRAPAGLVALTFAVGFVGGLRAATPETPSANYVYANYLGSGYYLVDNQQIAILNIPFSATRNSDDPYPSRWRLPVSLGSYSFKFDPNDVRGTDLPRDVATLTFVPGIEWIVPINESWHLEPYVDLGVGTNFGTHEEVLIYSTGVSAIYQFGSADQHQWINRILYAGDFSFTSKKASNFASYQTGINWQLPPSFTLRQRQFHTSVYGLVFWHFNSVKLTSHEFDAIPIRNNFEVGFTVGTEETPETRWYQITQVGFGYRFGDNFESWRLFFSKPI